MLTSKKETEDKTVLVIEDEDANFFALAAILKTRGFRCVSATNAAEAFTILKKTSIIDIILMDLMMPGIDGFEATKAIKSDEQFAHLPIVVLSALNTKEHKEKAFSSGANAYLTKPIDVDELLAVLKSFTPSSSAN